MKQQLHIGGLFAPLRGALWQGRPWLAAGGTLAAAVSGGLLLAYLIMGPPAGDLRALAVFLALSGVATMSAGWLALSLGERWLPMTIRTRAFLGAATSSAVALVNIFIVAQLMFVSSSHDLRLLVVLIGFSAGVTVFFSLRMASVLTAGVRTIATGISALAAGDYRIQVAVRGSDEVARLAGDVNGLARRLQAAEESRAAMERERRELTAAVSHDLRTPLASVRAMVEALDDRVVADPSEVTRYYGAMRREIDRLNRLIDDLFELAQIDAGALRLERRPLALQEVAAEVVDAMQAAARQAGVTVALSVTGEPPEIPLDGARIERAVANLLRNALQHTPVGGRVDVSVAEEASAVALRVRDSGDGIDPHDLPYIWERFYRAERSRRRGPGSADGAGLGLAIVRGIVETHGGSVEVASTPGEGAAFTLRLPRAEEHGLLPCL